MSDHEAKRATPHATLLAELLDSRIPKSEREHAAKREIERLTAERDELRRQLAEAWAEREAMANVLPGHYYMDPPDGGDVPVLEQLRRMAKDAARYRFLSCKGVPPYFHRCSRWRLEYWNGEWWDPLMKEELDAAIDAQIEKEERP